MNSILYGNLRIELIDGSGARVDRQASPPLSTMTPRPDSAHSNEPVFLAGRSEELHRIREAVRAQRLVQVSGSCGYGKTTLLRFVAAHAVAEGLAGFSAYLPATRGGTADLLHRLIGEIYSAEPPVKLTRSQCEQILGQVQALVILDDVTLSPAQLDDVRRVLPACSLLFSCQQPLLPRPEDTIELSGLDEEAALQVIVDGLGRPLTDAEGPPARQLAHAVDGHPLHLRQAAALAREGKWSFAELADMAVDDPSRVDRLSIGVVAQPVRQALAVLALAAGAFLPADLVGLMGSIAEIGACLRVLHRRGLADERQGRFGLPACKAEHYRQALLTDLDRATAVRVLVDWLAASNPAAPDSLSAASAALSIAEWVAGDEDWPAVVQLVRVIEPVLTLAGHWEASQHALTSALHAAHAIGDHLSEAFFAHEQGTLALCTDDLRAAQQLLNHALRLREEHGDLDGAALTRHNLDVLQPPAPAPPPAPRQSRHMLHVLASGGLLAVIGSIAGVLIATSTSAHQNPTAGPSSTVTITPTSSAASTASGPGSTGSSPGSTGTSSSPSGNNGGGLVPMPPSVSSANFAPMDITGKPAPISATLTVRNPNRQPLGISTVQTAAPFTITQDTCLGNSVPAQGSCSITVQFAPSAIGKYSHALTVRSAAGTSTAMLSGVGYVKLMVSIEGGGEGAVSDSEGLDCIENGAPTQGPTCSQEITGPVSLSASAFSDSQFYGWTGPCTPSSPSTTPSPGGTCEVGSLTNDATVIAGIELQMM